MTITRIGKKICIALPIQVGIVSMDRPTEYYNPLRMRAEG